VVASGSHQCWCKTSLISERSIALVVFSTAIFLALQPTAKPNRTINTLFHFHLYVINSIAMIFKLPAVMCIAWKIVYPHETPLAAARAAPLQGPTAQELVTAVFDQLVETKEEKTSGVLDAADVDSSSESRSRISTAFAKKNQKRALYESTRDEDSFELSTNLFDDSSYSYTNVHSLYSSKSSKPHSEAPYAKQVCIFMSCE
jgi:hypothetical protein